MAIIAGGVTGEALDLALDDEGVENGFDGHAVGFGELIDGFELVEEFAVGDAYLAGGCRRGQRRRGSRGGR